MDAYNTKWPRNVWTLADKANTTNDEGNVDEIDDYQPQLYAATLALLAANNGTEVEELQRRAKERVAYDYAGGGMCESAALYPAWMKERQAQCSSRAKAVELFNAEGSDGFNSGSVMHRLNDMENVAQLPDFRALGPPNAGPGSTQYGSPTLLDWKGLPPPYSAPAMSPPVLGRSWRAAVGGATCPFTGQPCGAGCGCRHGLADNTCPFTGQPCGAGCGCRHGLADNAICPFTGRPCGAGCGCRRDATGRSWGFRRYSTCCGSDCACRRGPNATCPLQGPCSPGCSCRQPAKPGQHAYQRFRDLPKKLSNSVRGALYDLRHWKQLPSVAAGEPGTKTIKYVFMRDNRSGYILMAIAIIFFIIALVSAMSSKN